MFNKIVTLDEFIIRSEKENPSSSGSFSRLLRDIGIAAKIVNREVNKAGLVNILGVEGSTNSTGDDVQKLDIFANEKFMLLKKIRNLYPLNPMILPKHNMSL